MLMGTFASNVGLAVADLAKQRKVPFLAAEPLTDKIVWDNGNKYTYPPARLDVHADGDARARSREARQEALGDRVSQLRIRAIGHRRVQEADDRAAKRRPRVRRAGGAARQDRLRVRSCRRCIDAQPDAIFSSLFGPDLARFVREGQLRGLFKDRPVFNLLGGEPEYLDPLKDEAPVGW